MKRLLLLGSVLLALGIAVQLPAQPPPDPEGNGDVPQVLAYGQLHEAYAQPTDGAATVGITVPKQPPEPVPEMPPEEKPEGDDVEWFPGYWSWDQEREDFIWISGVWRKLPAGQQFVPGYWAQEDQGWTWVSGFWTSTQQEELIYTPPPPKSLDNGPNQPQPAPQFVWSPGYWYFAGTGWFWHPGTWIEIRPGLIWVAPHYCWSPSGYLLVGGYWDHPLEERGLVFAPVYFPRAYWVNSPGWTYYPRTVLSVSFLTQSFFVGPHRHYYFGNYYGPKWQNAGYTAWVNHAPKVRDPLYTYYHQHNPQLLTSMNVVNKQYSSGTKALPPKFINQQNFVVNQVTKTTVNNTTVINNKTINTVNVKGPLQVVNLQGSKEPAKLPKVHVVSPEQVQKQIQVTKNLHAAGKNRKEQETQQAKQPTAPLGQGGTKPLTVPLKQMKLPAVTPTKVSPPKVETPPLPGVNTAPKPKPGVKPVQPEPKQPKPGIDPKKPDPKDPKPGVDPKKPDPKDPKPGVDPKKPDPKKPDPKDPKPGVDPKKPDPKKPDPKDPKPGVKPDPKEPKPGKPPAVQPPPPVSPPKPGSPPAVQPPNPIPPAPTPNPKPDVQPKPNPPVPPPQPMPEPPGKPPKKPPEEKKKKPAPPPSGPALTRNSLHGNAPALNASPATGISRRELAVSVISEARS